MDLHRFTAFVTEIDYAIALFTVLLAVVSGVVIEFTKYDYELNHSRWVVIYRTCLYPTAELFCPAEFSSHFLSGLLLILEAPSLQYYTH